MAARGPARRLLPALALLAACTAAPAPGAPGAAGVPAGAPRREVPWAALAAAPRPPADARDAYGSGPLQFGNAPERDGDVRGFPNFSEDINIFKVFRVADQKALRFEMQLGNLFDRIVYCNPNTNWSSGAFGQVFTQCNTPRSVQFGLRFDF